MNYSQVKRSVLILRQRQGSRRVVKDMVGNPFGFTLEDQVLCFETASDEKIVALQRLRFDNGEITLRLGYYMRTKRKKTGTEYWAWGQFCTMILEEDLLRLLKKAEKKGWLRFQVGLSIKS